MDEFFRESERMSLTALTPGLIAELDDSALDDWVWTRLLSFFDAGDPAALVVVPQGVRAYLTTRLFEWEVRNGGLHQYFFNYPSPDLFKLVLEGYSHLGLENARRTVEEVIAPLAVRESEWRESLRDGTIETFFESYSQSQLPDFDERIEDHDAERIEYVRANPILFSL